MVDFEKAKTTESGHGKRDKEILK